MDHLDQDAMMVYNVKQGSVRESWLFGEAPPIQGGAQHEGSRSESSIRSVVYEESCNEVY